MSMIAVGLHTQLSRLHYCSLLILSCLCISISAQRHIVSLDSGVTTIMAGRKICVIANISNISIQRKNARVNRCVNAARTQSP